MKLLLDQINYNQWANLRLINAASELDAQTFSQNVTSSFPSIRHTLVHIIWAEELWLERWQGRSFVQSLDANDYPTLDSIKQKITELAAQQIQFLKSLPPDATDLNVAYQNFCDERWEFSLRQMVQHMVIHSAYHRGQLVTLLRQVDITPPGTDYLLYIDSTQENED